jgi:ribA/ribD-fused uncharacterized protein
MAETIYFYDIYEEPYGCFSNFSRHGFDLNGHRWKTSEHYFQAQKYVNDKAAYEKVLHADTPRQAFNLGRDRSLPKRSDWESVKDCVMRKALLAKFTTHSDLREILLATKDRPIVEKTTDDYYWGCGTNGTGGNKLGLLLMELRDKLQK